MAAATSTTRRFIALATTTSLPLISLRAAGATSAVASSSRLRTFASSASVLLPETLSSSSPAAPAAARPIPPPRPNLSTPVEFLTAISTPRRDLASNSSAVTALGQDWSAIFTVKSEDLKKAGLGPKDRKYLLWAIEKLRQGQHPQEFAFQPKPKKKVRGWGPRVQTAERIRVRGRKRPGEK
ncbi:uncharacterized protein PFL1_02833 [Pseudozyma flocculosa PF-1]|uniref:Small ribosomal subunit protein mS41 n=2 Tax=Pseudozyma flocculosa TaxID=84751 RepID=A0A5C3F2E7_9BASI|nr:uncharacterized protein PFL1_02833 [Pseudozyma flocculosa PF-1]EPQ29614.1 hypothetical protein PFL1_02833 [Pseudozyma flocculosa PF-1]SPO38175.1 uncharacterized protein PSFLO_03652 [Pseudozyma flocculosa]